MFYVNGQIIFINFNFVKYSNDTRHWHSQEKFKQEFKMRLDFMAGKKRLTRDLSAFSSGRFEWRTNHVNTHERNQKNSSIVTNDTPLILTPDT